MIDTTLQRLAYIRVPVRDLIHFMGGGGSIQCAGLPCDARVLDIYMDFATNCFKVMLEHPSFYPMVRGSEAPCIGTAEFVSDGSGLGWERLHDEPFVRES